MWSDPTSFLLYQSFLYNFISCWYEKPSLLQIRCINDNEVSLKSSKCCCFVFINCNQCTFYWSITRNMWVLLSSLCKKRVVLHLLSKEGKSLFLLLIIQSIKCSSLAPAVKLALWLPLENDSSLWHRLPCIIGYFNVKVLFFVWLSVRVAYWWMVWNKVCL